ncbi:IS110 family transposase [Bacteroidia bacterium]|nr:IS110 family transposase [Bacteroidia bacterium]
MVSPLKYSVGIDAAKDEFQVAMLLQNSDLSQGVKGTRKFSNTPEGYKHFEQWILSHKKFPIAVHLTIEATGNYHENLVFYFYNQGFTVNVVLPNKAKKYLQSLGNKSKTDKIDARGLAQMGAEQQLRSWQPFSESIYSLRCLTRYCEQLLHSRTMYRNQLMALSYGMYQVPEVKKRLQQLIETVEKQIDEVKQEIETTVRNDKKIWSRMENILTIKGLGIYSLAVIVAETNGFELFVNERQLCSYAGYDVIENQSGTRKGKTRISKKGNSHIRRILYMPSLNMVKYGNEKFVQLYERIMSRHSKKMVAYVAIQRKLLALIYALWKKNEEYKADYQWTFGNDESKSLFPVVANGGKKSSPKQIGATQDELSYNESSEVLFPVAQR